ncbi:hypothetical protein U91I_02207 [alpha proteobacterium U9-1i]|nr:hypothetical protein U91I_02207 [alpha proteobacterium U9-1i]
MNLALTLTLAQYGFLAVSISALALLLAAGKTPERIAAATLTCLMFVSPYLTREGPVWPALASGITLTILVTLALRYERWWLIGASGFQLVIFSTHFATLVSPQEYIWPGITLRLILWGGIMALCLFALGESRWAPYARAKQLRKRADTPHGLDIDPTRT